MLLGGEPEVPLADDVGRGEHRRALDHVAELAHVARPAVREQRLLRVLAEARARAAELGAEAREEVLSERDDVAAPARGAAGRGS